MSFGEQTLLAVLAAFAAGVALGRLWSRGAASNQARRRETSSIHYILGLDFLASRQIDRAIAELTVAARKNTEAIEIYLILGNLLREKGQIERAIQIHQSVLHRPSLSAQERAHALLCLGMDFKRAGFRNRAMDTFSEVVRQEPGNAYALMNLIKIYEVEHDWEKALETQEQLRRVSGELDTTLKAFLYDQIGQAAFHAEAHTPARRAFDEAIRAAPSIPAPYLHYGDMLVTQGELEQAEAKWMELAHEQPRLAHFAFERLERVRDELGRNDDTIQLYSSVMDDDDNDWRAHLALARLRSARGETDEAFELLVTALGTNPHALALHLELWRSFVSEPTGHERIPRYLDVIDRSALILDPYICMKCNYRANGVLWRCPHCQEWNTFVEERIDRIEG